eukprot:scaffold92223_cov28-Tisochrysis_lutea.AAC.2
MLIFSPSLSDKSRIGSVAARSSASLRILSASLCLATLFLRDWRRCAAGRRAQGADLGGGAGETKEALAAVLRARSLRAGAPVILYCRVEVVRVVPVPKAHPDEGVPPLTVVDSQHKVSARVYDRVNRLRARLGDGACGKECSGLWVHQPNKQPLAR